MSKFLEAIEAKRDPRGLVRPKMEHLKPVDLRIEEDIVAMPFSTVSEYRIGIALGTVQFCADGDELQTAKMLVTSQIKEFVFGEFRPLLARLDSMIGFAELRDSERRELHEAVEEISRRMGF